MVNVAYHVKVFRRQRPTWSKILHWRPCMA